MTLSIGNSPLATAVRFGKQTPVQPAHEFPGNEHSGSLTAFLAEKTGQQITAFSRQKPLIHVINNQNDFQQLNDAVRLVPYGSPLPVVDFDRQAVVLVLDKPSTSGSPTPDKTKLSFDGERLKVSLGYTQEHGFTTVMGNPFYVAVVDKNQVKKQPVAG